MYEAIDVANWKLEVWSNDYKKSIDNFGWYFSYVCKKKTINQVNF